MSKAGDSLSTPISRRNLLTKAGAAVLIASTVGAAEAEHFDFEMEAVCRAIERAGMNISVDIADGVVGRLFIFNETGLQTSKVPVDTWRLFNTMDRERQVRHLLTTGRASRSTRIQKYL